MPEYGRYVQKMLQQVKTIPNREKRNEQVQAAVSAMGILNPHLRDMNDFKQKLWDHAFVISDFELDIDSPYPKPTSESFRCAPNRIELEDRKLRITYYGRNIQNITETLAQWPEGTERDEMVIALAYYMRKQYVIWNKDSVADKTIFDDIVTLSHGRLHVPQDLKMDEIQGEAIRQSYFQSKNGQQRGGLNPNGHRNKKRRKKQQKQ